MRRSNPARKDGGFIGGVDTIDESAIPRRFRVEVMAETPVDERVDHVSETDERMEMESFEQQRKNVLGADSFKPFG